MKMNICKIIKSIAWTGPVDEEERPINNIAYFITWLRTHSLADNEQEKGEKWAIIIMCLYFSWAKVSYFNILHLSIPRRTSKNLGLWCRFSVAFFEKFRMEDFELEGNNDTVISIFHQRVKYLGEIYYATLFWKWLNLFHAVVYIQGVSVTYLTP